MLPFRSLLPFLLIAFGLAWSILGLFIFFGDQMTRVFGALRASHPLFVLSVYSPAIAALIVVARCGGVAGLRGYLSRLLLWRCSRAWAAFLILGIPLIYVAGSAVKGNLLQDPFPFSGLGAGLILGLIWGVWHLPAFFLSGAPQGAWDFTPFFIGSVSISVILTPLFNSARGSILLAALYHFQLNNPLFPDAQPHDIVFFVATAVLVVWLNRKTMLTREGAVTKVVPSDPARA